MRKCSAQKQNIFYHPLWQLPRQKNLFLTSQTHRGRDRKWTAVGLEFCFRFLSGIGQQRDTEANMFATRVNAKRGRPPSRCHHARVAKSLPNYTARYPGETFINFVTERANGFRSSGRTLSITGTSPGANSISHSHPFSSNSTIFTASTLLSPWRCSIPSASNGALSSARATYLCTALSLSLFLSLSPSTQPPPSSHCPSHCSESFRRSRVVTAPRAITI